jgi:hypothetical protein
MGQFHVYARLFLDAKDDGERAQVFADVCEWLEAKSETTIEIGLKTRIFAILCTREGADFLRWVTGNDPQNDKP